MAFGLPTLRHPRLAAILLILAAACSGCGGSDEATPVAGQGADQPGGSVTATDPSGGPTTADTPAKSPQAADSPTQRDSSSAAGGAAGTAEAKSDGVRGEGAGGSCQGLSRRECAQLARGSRQQAPSHLAKPGDCTRTMTRAECRALIAAEQNAGPSHPAGPKDCLRTMTRAQCKTLIAEELK